MKTATATIKGFEIMQMIGRRHCLTCKPGVHNEIHFVNWLSWLPHDPKPRRGYAAPQRVNATESALSGSGWGGYIFVTHVPASHTVAW